jgi:hypothetical protein
MALNALSRIYKNTTGILVEILWEIVKNTVKHQIDQSF